MDAFVVGGTRALVFQPFGSCSLAVQPFRASARSWREGRRRPVLGQRFRRRVASTIIVTFGRLRWQASRGQ
eukprot:11194888-Lingulodinium_polyedra.AAC.1